MAGGSWPPNPAATSADGSRSKSSTTQQTAASNRMPLSSRRPIGCLSNGFSRSDRQCHKQCRPTIVASGASHVRERVPQAPADAPEELTTRRTCAGQAGCREGGGEIIQPAEQPLSPDFPTASFGVLWRSPHGRRPWPQTRAKDEMRLSGSRKRSLLLVPSISCALGGSEYGTRCRSSGTVLAAVLA